MTSHNRMLLAREIERDKETCRESESLRRECEWSKRSSERRTQGAREEGGRRRVAIRYGHARAAPLELCSLGLRV